MRRRTITPTEASPVSGVSPGRAARRDGVAPPRRWGLIAVALLAFGFMLWKVDVDLPFVYNLDELYFTVPPLEHFMRGDFNPHAFYHPGTPFMYAVWLPLYADYRIGAWTGRYADRAEFIAVHRRNPTFPIVAGRTLSSIFGAVSLFALYGIYRSLYGPAGALAAAVFLAVFPMFAQQCRLARTDAMALALVLGTIYCALRSRRAGPAWGAAALFLAGLATATKYVALAAAVPAFLAWIWSVSAAPRRLPLYLLAPVLFAAGMFAGSPYLFLDVGTAARDFAEQSSFVTAGYPGLVVPAKIGWYFGRVLPTACGGAAVPLLAVAGLGALSRKRRRETVLLLLFPLLYVLGILSHSLRFPRYMFYLLPFAALLAARFLEKLAEILFRRRPARARFFFWAATAAVAALPAARSLRTALELNEPDARTTAREWIEENVPAGSCIAYEAFCPPLHQLDGGRYRLLDTSWNRIVSKPLEYYSRRGCGYLVLSRDQRRAIERNSRRWPHARERYSRIDREGELIASPSGRLGRVVDIYRLPPPPEH
ncbi:MAG TPA: glycosyltransferase family 39 protein [bacterium]|nr:glycosyltransferase family 39 protein [bacterium]